jgi:hypothetical protein
MGSRSKFVILTRNIILQSSLLLLTLIFILNTLRHFSCKHEANKPLYQPLEFHAEGKIKGHLTRDFIKHTSLQFLNITTAQDIT